MEKRTASDDVVPLCGIVGDYRTFIETSRENWSSWNGWKEES